MGDWEDLCDSCGLPYDVDGDWWCEEPDQSLYSDASEKHSNHEINIFTKPKNKYGMIVDDSNWEVATHKIESDPGGRFYFNNHIEMRNFAKKHPGTCFTRNPTGDGYIIKNIDQASSSALKYNNIKQCRPPKSHYPWTEQEISNLIELYNNEDNIHKISVIFKRSPISILSKLKNLGLISAEEHKSKIDSPEYHPCCNELFEFFIKNDYVAVNLLSRFYPLGDYLINKYANILNFQELSSSEYVDWNSEIINRYINRWNWYKLSNNTSLPWSETLIDKHEKYWTWGDVSESRRPAYDGTGGIITSKVYNFGISNNTSIPWTEKLIEKYKDKWSWNFFWGTTLDWRVKKLIFSNNKSLPWSEALIEKYASRWDWFFLSTNELIPWSEALIEKFEDRLSWHRLSQNEALPWSNALIEKYKDKWDWRVLSRIKSIPWSETLLETYKDKWDWSELSKNESLPWSASLLEKYQDIWVWYSSTDVAIGVNEAIPWTKELIEKYKDKLKFFSDLSENKSVPWSEALIKRYIDKWSWDAEEYFEYLGGLSSNEGLPWTDELIEQFIDKWNFGNDLNGGLSSNEGLPWTEALFEKYIDKWYFECENWDEDVEDHGGINRNISLPWSANFIQKHTGRWDWDHLIKNKGLVWDEALLMVFISLNRYPPQTNSEVHQIIKNLTSSQVQIILEKYENDNI